MLLLYDLSSDCAGERQGGNPIGKALVILKFEKCLCVCLSANSSAVYGPMGTKLGRGVGDGHGIQLETLVSMETELYSQKMGYSLTAHPFG